MIERNGADNPLNLEGQTEAGLKALFGNNLAFHHTILRSDEGLSYGLYGDKETAMTALAKIINNAARPGLISIITKGKRKSQEEANALASEWRENAEIIELNRGDTYHTWGNGCSRHGYNDGTHGSRKKERDED